MGASASSSGGIRLQDVTAEEVAGYVASLDGGAYSQYAPALVQYHVTGAMLMNAEKEDIQVSSGLEKCLSCIE